MIIIILTLFHLSALMVDLRLNLCTNSWSVLSQRLTRLIPCLLIAYIIPKPRFGFFRQEPSGRRLSSNLGYNTRGNKSLLSFEASRQIDALALLNQVAESFIARMGVDGPSSATKHIIVVWLGYQVFPSWCDHLFVGHVCGWRR
jgi:hypothetical protein